MLGGDKKEDREKIVEMAGWGDVWSSTCQLGKPLPCQWSVTPIIARLPAYTPPHHHHSCPLPLQLPASSLFFLPIPLHLIWSKRPSLNNFYNVPSSWPDHFHMAQLHILHQKSKVFFVWKVFRCRPRVRMGAGVFHLKLRPPSPAKSFQQWSAQLTRVIVGTLCNSQNTYKHE